MNAVEPRPVESWRLNPTSHMADALAEVGIELEPEAADALERAYLRRAGVLLSAGWTTGMATDNPAMADEVHAATERRLRDMIGHAAAARVTVTRRGPRHALAELLLFNPGLPWPRPSSEGDRE